MAEYLAVSVMSPRGRASVMARKGVDAARIGAVLGFAMPEGPRAATGNGLTALGTGPGSWLVSCEEENPAFAEELAGKLSGLAAVADQSSAYHVVRFAGPGARRLLQSAIPVDLDPAVFGPGHVAVTQMAHLGVIVWQVDESPAFEVACFRSYAGSFHHWLDEAMAAL